MLNFETKDQRRLLLYAFKLILTNIQSELIDKSAIISTQRWTALVQPTQRWAALPCANGRVDRILKEIVRICIKTSL